MDKIERLMALEKDIRNSGGPGCQYHADQLASLIAELGQEVGAVEPVAFAVELPDGSIGKLGWMDYASFDLCTGVSELLEGCRYVYAYRTPPAHTSEARDAARYRWLRDSYDPSVHDGDCDSVFDLAGNRFDEKLDLLIENDSYDAAMRQEGGNG